MNDDTPVLTLGDFTIAPLADGKIYIGHKDGEAGSFDAAKFEEAVREFFKREF